ncbi:MAG: hypothetical protein GY757_41810 [bacterium]|nr:hypothetical protein [bacterium]
MQAAGYDLYSAYDYVISAKGKQLCKTDIQVRSFSAVSPKWGTSYSDASFAKRLCTKIWCLKPQPIWTSDGSMDR